MRLRLQNRRKELRLTQHEVAERAGLTRSNYSHIETGRNEPSIEQMEAIAKVLGMDKVEVNFFRDFCDKMEQKPESAG